MRTFSERRNQTQNTNVGNTHEFISLLPLTLPTSFKLLTYVSANKLGSLFDICVLCCFRLNTKSFFSLFWLRRHVKRNKENIKLSSLLFRFLSMCPKAVTFENKRFAVINIVFFSYQLTSRSCFWSSVFQVACPASLQCSRLTPTWQESSSTEPRAAKTESALERRSPVKSAERPLSPPLV